MDGNPVNESYISYDSDYLKFICINNNCNIKLQWGIEIPINTYYNKEISELIVIDTEIGEEISEINASFKLIDPVNT